MDIRNVSPGFAVAPQIKPEDIPALAQAGFRTLICNRPDAEEADQPSAAELRKAAEAAGIAFHHIPVAGGEFPAAAIAAFRAVRRGSEGRVVAYCRTGTRSITLEALANPGDLDASQRLERAAAAGYDLAGLTERLGQGR